MKSPLTLRKNFWRLWVEEQHQQLPEGDVAERLAGEGFLIVLLQSTTFL